MNPSGVRLRVMTKEDAEQIRRWRNEIMAAWRTPYLLTAEMQEQFYSQVICARDTTYRYWAVDDNALVGMVGLTDVEWTNHLAQISLITDPQARGRGYGGAAVALVLDEAFMRLGLATVYGECYECNPGCAFWRRMVERHHGYTTMLPRRKFWDGRLWDSLYFSFTKESYSGDTIPDQN